MRDSFNSMSMTMGSGSTLLNSKAATFAPAEQALTQAQASFYDLLKSESKSFSSQQAATDITRDELLEAEPAPEMVNAGKGELPSIGLSSDEEIASDLVSQLERGIEQRITQPIGELIGQSCEKNYNAKADELTEQMEVFINQQQLAASMKTVNRQAITDISLSNIVNNDNKSSADTINADEAITDGSDVDQALLNGNEGEVNAKAANSFDNLLKQMEMAMARSTDNNSGVKAGSDAVLSQQAAIDKGLDSALAAKESLSQATSVSADQVLSKVPLAQDAHAAKMLKERVSLMVTGKVQQAVIQLDPEELGGMNIRLQLQNEQMSVQFQVQNAQAKELLENAMVKLREMLDQQGIVLKDSDVHQQDQPQQQDLTEPSQQRGNPDEGFVSDQDAIVLTLHKQSSDGIDYYA